MANKVQWIKPAFKNHQGDINFLMDGITLLVGNLAATHGKRLTLAEKQLLIEHFASEIMEEKRFDQRA